MFGELNQCTIQLLSRKGGSEIIPTRIKHGYLRIFQSGAQHSNVRMPQSVNNFL